MSVQHPARDPRTPPDEALPRKSASPVVWIAILLVLLALIVFFMSRRDAAVPPPAPATPIGEVIPTDAAPPATATRSSTPADRRAPTAAPADREARPLQQPAPEYPASAVRAGDEGTVLVRAEVGADGKPGTVELAQRSRSRDLDRAALAAVRGWTFEPALRDGKPVASTVQVPVDFRLATQ